MEIKSVAKKIGRGFVRGLEKLSSGAEKIGKKSSQVERNLITNEMYYRYLNAGYSSKDAAVMVLVDYYGYSKNQAYDIIYGRPKIVSQPQPQAQVKSEKQRYDQLLKQGISPSIALRQIELERSQKQKVPQRVIFIQPQPKPIPRKARYVKAPKRVVKPTRPVDDIFSIGIPKTGKKKKIKDPLGF